MIVATAGKRKRASDGATPAAPLPRSLVDMAAEDTVLCVVEMLDITWATLLLLDDPADPRGGYVRHRATRNEGGAIYDRRVHPQPAPALWPEGLACRTPIEGDAAVDVDHNRRAYELGVHSYLAVSLHPTDTGPPLGILFLNRDHSEPFVAREKETARRLAARVADIIAHARRDAALQAEVDQEREEAEHAHALLVREQAARAVAESQQERLAFLAEVSNALAASLDYHATLQQVAQLAVPVLADWCTVNIIEEDGGIRRLAVAHFDAAKVELVQALEDLHPIHPDLPAGPATVLRIGQSRIVPRVTEADLDAAAPTTEYRVAIKRIGVHSAMYVPLVARDRLLGVMTFVSSESRRRYGQPDLALAEALAQRCAIAIDNARLYQLAQEAIVARERFIAVASHELRTPVTNVSGYAQLLQRAVEGGGLDAERAEKYVERLVHSAQKLVKLTTDLLDVSRLRTGKLTLQTQHVDLAARVREVLERYRPQFNRQHHVLTEGLDIPMPIVADVNRLEQVLINLIENAIKYSPDGGEIGLVLRPEEAGALLQVRDSGIGLPPGATEAIFAPFGRGANAEQLVLPGLGLGLYICRMIAESHGGRIWADSAGEGQGTTISLWLPANAGRASAAQTAAGGA